MSAPTLAEVQALAARCKAGELDACAEYQEAAKALLDEVGSFLHEDSEREAEQQRLWKLVVDLNTEILDARDREEEGACSAAPIPENEAAAVTLLPCPFCGETENLHREHMTGTIIHPAYRICCHNCGASNAYTDRGDEVETWNRRQPTEASVRDGRQLGGCVVDAYRDVDGSEWVPLDQAQDVIARIKGERLKDLEDMAGVLDRLDEANEIAAQFWRESIQHRRRVLTLGELNHDPEKLGAIAHYIGCSRLSDEPSCGWPGRHFDLRGIASNREVASAVFGFAGDEPYTFEEVHLVLGNRCVGFALTEPQIAKLLAAGGKPC